MTDELDKAGLAAAWAVISRAHPDQGLFDADRSVTAAAIRAYLAVADGWRPIETADDPVTTVYGRLLHRHMKAARKDFHGPLRARIFSLIEALRLEFPDECQVWDDRYSETPSPPKEG